VLAAIVADYLKPFRRILTQGRFFRTATRAALRRHHIALIKEFLLLFTENEYFAALHAWYFDIGHYVTSTKQRRNQNDCEFNTSSVMS
jgi:hypothetical protein